jgi:hypothetical protein
MFRFVRLRHLGSWKIVSMFVLPLICARVVEPAVLCFPFCRMVPRAWCVIAGIKC